MFKLNIVRSDIIPIVNYAWARSFNNVSTNKKAIRDRGWGPHEKSYFSIQKFHVPNHHQIHNIIRIIWESMIVSSQKRSHHHLLKIPHQRLKLRI